MDESGRIFKLIGDFPNMELSIKLNLPYLKLQLVDSWRANLNCTNLNEPAGRFFNNIGFIQVYANLRIPI